MHILIGLVVAPALLYYWITGHIVARVLVWIPFSVVILIAGDSEAGRIFGDGPNFSRGILWLLCCGVGGWIAASIPTYIIELRAALGRWWRIRQSVLQNDRARYDAGNTRWAGDWIRSHYHARGPSRRRT